MTVDDPTSQHRLPKNSGLWLYAGFGITAIGGLAANVVVVAEHGRYALGIFSTCMSLLLVLGQVGTLGQQSACLYFVPTSRASGDEPKSVLHASLLNALTASVTVTSLVAIVNEVIIESSEFRVALRGTYLAILIFPLSKVLVAYLTGLSHVRAVAMANAARLGLLPFLVVLTARLGGGPTTSAWSLSIAECIVVVFLVARVRRDLGGLMSPERRLVSSTRSFGVRTMSGTLLLDANTRVDVFVLSVARGADTVGKYTIASTIAEGLYQLFMVMRTVVEPLSARLWAAGDIARLKEEIRSRVKKVTLAAIPIAAMSILVFPVATRVLYGSEASTGTFPIFVALALGIAIGSGFIPFTTLLSQTGDPSGYSYSVGTIAALNLMLNLALVPFFGALGAAMATAMAQVMLGPVLVLLMRNRRGVHLW